MIKSFGLYFYMLKIDSSKVQMEAKLKPLLSGFFLDDLGLFCF